MPFLLQSLIKTHTYQLMNRRLSLLCTLCGTLTLLPSCTTSLDRAEEAGFISDKVSKKEDLLPFTRSYIAPEYAKARTTYNKIHIPLPDTEIIAKQFKLDEEQKVKAHQALVRWKSKIEKEILEKSKNTMQIVQAPGKDTLTLNLYLLDISKTNVIMNTLTFLIPLPLSSQTGHLFFQGRVDLAGNLIEDKTGQKIAEFYDHNPGKYSVYSIKDYERYGHSIEAFDNWTEIFGKMFSGKKAEKVNKPLGVTLKPI